MRRTVAVKVDQLSDGRLLWPTDRQTDKSRN